MASSRVVERGVREEPRRAAASSPDFCNQKYSLVIIIGQISHPSQAGYIVQEIERGIRSWDVDLTVCNLNQHLRDFLSHHTLQILKGTGQRCLRYSSEVLDTLVLISPSQENICSEVCGLLGSKSGNKLLVLAGQSVEETGDLLIQRGLFSPHQLTHILTEQFLDPPGATSSSLPVSTAHLTLSCPNVGQWKRTLLENQPFQGPLALCVNPPAVLPAMEALGEFTSLLSGTLSPPSPFDQLQPPGTVGFLKLSRPCCYVFPAGRGDCAFFAVNGFTVLVDGGSDPQACFWKLVRHLDRVDAVLLTHVGTENLPGVNALLERKVAELEMGFDVKGDLAKRLISPEIGVVFFNGPNKLQVELQPDGVLRSKDQAALTLRLLKKLDITPQPLTRPRGAPVHPLTLFQKMGVGRLELYVLNPVRQSPEYQALLQGWPDAPPLASSSSQPQTPPRALPVTALASVCALLVWHPACPQEKVVRVLFPGVAPQGKLLEGLEKLRGLAFLQRPTVTTGEMEGGGEAGEAGRTESQDAGRVGGGKEAGPRPGSWAGKERGSQEEVKKEENEKEKTKATNGHGAKEEAKKDRDKLGAREGGVKQRAGWVGGKKEESGPKKKEQKKTEPLSSKPKNGNRSKPKKDLKNEARTGKAASKPKKEAKTDANLDAKKTQGSAGSSERAKDNPAHPRAGSATGATLPESAAAIAEAGGQDAWAERNPAGSRMSTPEDMTAEFLRLREETGGEEAERKGALDERGGEGSGETGRSEGVSGKEADGGVAVEAGRTGGGGRDGNEGGERRRTGVTAAAGGLDQMPQKPPANVAGFPAPPTKPPKGERNVQLDLTPTEYTLLEGGLRESPLSRPSPEGGQCPPSPDPDEETVGAADSADSRPNSAGHTPYGLSPDDVWCCGDNNASGPGGGGRSSSLEATDNQPLGSNMQAEGQPTGPESKTTTNPREKHLSFLSLSSLKEGLPDASPSVTTTTTHSLPAEVSSPQSTEVDESLSMSFEQGPTTGSQREGEDSNQSYANGSHFVESDFRVGMSLPIKKPHRSLGMGSETGRPPGPNTLHFESSAHDVDLCLVSPCEFKHFKPPDSISQQPQVLDADDHTQEVAGPRSYSSNNNNNNRDTSASESNAPLCTEDCPSTTADGVLDSDDESCSDPPPNSLHDNPALYALPPDPPPAPRRDAPPLPPQPGSCMPVPAPDAQTHGRGVRSAGMRGKKLPGVSEVSQRPGLAGGLTQTGKARSGAQSGATKGVRNTKAGAGKSGCKAVSEGVVSVYVDLAYLPSVSASETVDVEFFRRVRSSCYIVSGDSPEEEGLMRPMLDSLLEAKASWPDSAQVTLIPTYESAAMQEWYQQTLDRQRELAVSVLGSNSTVAMQDETFPACKIEF